MDINKNKENLKKELLGLSNNEYYEIFNIIKDEKIQFTENKNGVFINLKGVNEETINKIYNFIDFCKDNKKNLEKIEEKQNYEVKISNNLSNRNTNSYIVNVDNDEIMTNIEEEIDINKKVMNNENFTFQNFIDKFTITNMKMFPENEKIVYPSLKQFKCNFTGVKNRVLKRCREISKTSNDKFMTLLFFEMEDGQLDNKNNTDEKEENYDNDDSDIDERDDSGDDEYDDDI
jgi:hypothetical protein